MIVRIQGIAAGQYMTSYLISSNNANMCILCWNSSPNVPGLTGYLKKARLCLQIYGNGSYHKPTSVSSILLTKSPRITRVHCPI